MTSDELNKAISDICDDCDIYGYESFGGKCIAYIGWYWRDVDFDREDGYSFGIFADGHDFGAAPGKVGFMENNKWGYKYVRADADEWKNIKELLALAVGNPNETTLKAADDAIQALAKKEAFE